MSQSVRRRVFRRLLAASAVVAGALAAPVVQAAEGDVWTLQEINLNSVGAGLYKSVSIVAQHYDAKGGFIEFNLDGDDGLHTCPGGTETIRYSWNFVGDVTQLIEGSDTVVEVHGEFLHLSAPCTGHIAAQSRMSAGGTKGGSPGLPDDQLKVVDSDRTFAVKDTIDTRFAFASDAEGGITSTTRYIHLDVYEPPADRPYAYFMVQFGLFGAGGMQAAYVYKKGTDTPLQPVMFSVEPGFDRPGQDYRDFDLPQADASLCRGACAAEDMCAAFTYVKPGVQADAPRCWLKSGVPPGYASDCCVSGVRN